MWISKESWVHPWPFMRQYFLSHFTCPLGTHFNNTSCWPNADASIISHSWTFRLTLIPIFSSHCYTKCCHWSQISRSFLKRLSTSLYFCLITPILSSCQLKPGFDLCLGCPSFHWTARKTRSRALRRLFNAHWSSQEVLSLQADVMDRYVWNGARTVHRQNHGIHD